MRPRIRASLCRYFRVPPQYQNRVLSWGIVGAVLMRGVMIVAGVAAVQRFRWTTLLFAGILFLSAIKLLMEGDEDDEDVDDRLVMRLARRVVGATAEYRRAARNSERRRPSRLILAASDASRSCAEEATETTSVSTDSCGVGMRAAPSFLRRRSDGDDVRFD